MVDVLTMATRIQNIKIGSINICGLSSRSKMMLEKYIDDEAYDVMVVQETGTDDPQKMEICNMNVIADNNKASNRGVAIYVNNKKCSITKLNSISQPYKNIDSTWGLTVIENNRYIIGTVYMKLNYQYGMAETLNMLKEALYYVATE